MIREIYLAVNKNNPNEYHSFTWTGDDKLIVNGNEVSLDDWEIEAFGQPLPQNNTYIPPKQPKVSRHSLAVDWLAEQLANVGVVISDDGIMKVTRKIQIPQDMLEQARDMEIDGQYSSYGEGYDEGLYDGMYK